MKNCGDRRQKRTKRAIQKAFIALCLKEELTKISVTDIAGLADINRSTFYLHYGDPADILEDIEREAADEVFSITEKYDFYQLAKNPYPLLAALSEELKQDPEFERFVIESSASSRLLEYIKKEFKNKVLSAVAKDFDPKRKLLISYAVTFVTSGIVDVYGEWMRGGKKTPLNDLCAALSKQISSGVTALMEKE